LKELLLENVSLQLALFSYQSLAFYLLRKLIVAQLILLLLRLQLFNLNFHLFSQRFPLLPLSFHNLELFLEIACF